jgi:hypothetical protein
MLHQSSMSNLALQQVLWAPLRLCSHSVLQQSTGFGGSVFEHPFGDSVVVFLLVTEGIFMASDSSSSRE